MLAGKPVFVHALSNEPAQVPRRLAAGAHPGRHKIRFEFAYDGGGIGKGGTGTLFVDGTQVVRGRSEQMVRAKFSLDETFDVGADTGTPVLDDYADRMPFEFTGRLQKLTIDLKGGAEQFQQGAVLENPLPQ